MEGGIGTFGARPGTGDDRLSGLGEKLWRIPGAGAAFTRRQQRGMFGFLGPNGAGKTTTALHVGYH
jgi:hypothetical protein